MDLHRSGPPPRVIDCLRAGLPLSSLLQHLLLDLGHPDVLVLGNTTAQLRGSSSEPRSVSPRFRCHAAKHVPNVSDLRVHKLLPRDPLTGTRGPESTAPRRSLVYCTGREARKGVGRCLKISSRTTPV